MNLLKVCANVCLLIAISHQLQAQVNNVMSYNIRYANPGDGVDVWENRRGEVVNLIKYYDLDVLGIQEGLIEQVRYLDEHLSNYSRVGVGRDDGKEKGEFCAIFFNSEKLDVISEGTFWLSETSDEISVGWDASMERICTYGLFGVRESGDKIFVFNAHYDHIGKQARNESSKLILKKIKELNVNDLPVILMGDFNALPADLAITTILQEFPDTAGITTEQIYGPKGTYTGFTKNAIAEKRIDYIFTQGLQVSRYRHIDDKKNDNNYVSDHLPVMVQFKN